MQLNRAPIYSLLLSFAQHVPKLYPAFSFLYLFLQNFAGSSRDRVYHRQSYLSKAHQRLLARLLFLSLFMFIFYTRSEFTPMMSLQIIRLYSALQFAGAC